MKVNCCKNRYQVGACVKLRWVYFLVTCVKNLFVFKFFVRDNTAMSMSFVMIEWKIELLTLLFLGFSSMTDGKFELYLS